MGNEVNDFLKDNNLEIVELYISSLQEASYNKDYLVKKVDGKGEVKKGFVVVDKFDKEELDKGNSIYFEGVGSSTKEDLKNNIRDNDI